MTEMPGQPPPEKPERTVEDVLWMRVERKRERIRSQVERDRRGGHKVPTWVLAVILGAIVLGWLCLILLG